MIKIVVDYQDICFSTENSPGQTPMKIVGDSLEEMNQMYDFSHNIDFPLSTPCVNK
jgi:hypothetical protein